MFSWYLPQSPVTSEQQGRSVAADLMEVSSLYGSHRAALIAWVCDWTEVSLYSCFHRLAESCSAFWNVIFTASVWFLWLPNFSPAQDQRIPVAVILYSSCNVRTYFPLHKHSPRKQVLSPTHFKISAIFTIQYDMVCCGIDSFDEISFWKSPNALYI